jgi:uncharacterized membrane protein/protein-disulfide isomerase
MQQHPPKNPYEKRWPFPVYASFFCLLVAAGIADTLYLSYSHYRAHTDVFYSSFCAISQAFNCDTVSQSRYAVFLHVPVAIWGLLGYLLLALLMPLALSKKARQERMWPLFILICAVFCGISLWLGYISSAKIHSYCLMCLVSYAINLLLLFSAHVIRTRYGRSSFPSGLKHDIDFLWRHRRKAIGLMLPIIIAWVLFVSVVPRYWVPEPLMIPKGIGRGVTEEGHPWIGAQNPVVEITEFADYQCFQCWKMHQILRRVVAKFPDKMRVVHVHFPMDHTVNPIVQEPFHIGSGLMAKMAIYAMEKGKFWEMNDYLYYHWRLDGMVSIHRAAAELNLDEDEMRRAVRSKYIQEVLLKLNIRPGMKRRILGTPSFVIDGKVYQGTFPFEIINRLSDD